MSYLNMKIKASTCDYAKKHILLQGCVLLQIRDSYGP